MLNAKLNIVAEAKKHGMKFRFASKEVTIKGEPSSQPVIEWLGASASILDDVLKE